MERGFQGMDKSVIDQALETIKELDRLYDSDNVIIINQWCNRLSNLSVNIGKMVSDARKLWKTLDAEYDNLVESKKLELIESGTGVGKAETMAKVTYYQNKKEAIEAENGYDRLNRFLNRIDTVLDSNKQYTSTVKKTNLKGI